MLKVKKYCEILKVNRKFMIMKNIKYILKVDTLIGGKHYEKYQIEK